MQETGAAAGADFDRAAAIELGEEFEAEQEALKEARVQRHDRFAYC